MRDSAQTSVQLSLILNVPFLSQLLLLKNFPYFNFLSPSFISSIGNCGQPMSGPKFSKWPLIDLSRPVFLIINHYLAFSHFSSVYYPFNQIIGYFTLCLWLVPFAFFISLSANDNTLPQFIENKPLITGKRSSSTVVCQPSLSMPEVNSVLSSSKQIRTMSYQTTSQGRPRKWAYWPSLTMRRNRCCQNGWRRAFKSVPGWFCRLARWKKIRVFLIFVLCRSSSNSPTCTVVCQTISSTILFRISPDCSTPRAGNVKMFVHLWTSRQIWRPALTSNL